MTVKQEQPVRGWALRLDVRTESKTHVKAGEQLTKCQHEVGDRLKEVRRAWANRQGKSGG